MPSLSLRSVVVVPQLCHHCRSLASRQSPSASSKVSYDGLPQLCRRRSLSSAADDLPQLRCR
ncbi:hypothetical protein F2Q69_00030364 [Brassica cretica]|uniref:Uncharacterized protein n=1 Tax=Brassica cretica TaxID=69181 RepID=A0A8S9S8M6_BRACR|nr:hypothetical protein F2Q69_00030364 [Brassica cretica]